MGCYSGLILNIYFVGWGERREPQLIESANVGVRTLTPTYGLNEVKRINRE
jgi:hypothetical protein